MLKLMVTGAAGFIGYHTSLQMLNDGHTVIGIDNLNDYYDPALKHSRLSHLQQYNNFTFIQADIADRHAIEHIVADHADTTYIIHLAAQGGVRYSVGNPYAFNNSNLTGHLVMLEAARHLPKLQHFVYASSSSVYGNQTATSLSPDLPTDTPVSLYAATKKAAELMTHSYVHLYGFPATGLRFFTVYGPFGRPDMAYFSFTRDILNGTPIRIFNHGDMRRDFTWIGDIVAGVKAALHTPPEPDAPHCTGGVAHRIFNLGNNTPEKLSDFIAHIESALNIQAEKIMMPMQAGDVQETYADITPAKSVLGYRPQTSLSIGIPQFVSWYRDYYQC